jgi:hypothetical protein
MLVVLPMNGLPMKHAKLEGKVAEKDMADHEKIRLFDRQF